MEFKNFLKSSETSNQLSHVQIFLRNTRKKNSETGIPAKKKNPKTIFGT